MINAAVIGLGLAGFRSELDPLRDGIWSHATAYKSADGVCLAAAVEPHRKNREDFNASYPEVPVYSTVGEMLDKKEIDLASVCVPTEVHAPVVHELAGRVKGIFCEKPLASNILDAEAIVSICKATDTCLAVNFVRCWDSSYMIAREWLEQGMIGELRNITGHYAGELLNIGSHLIHIMGFFAGKVAEVAGFTEKFHGEREPAGSMLLRYENGIPGFLVTHGIRLNGLFEVDMIGSKGRIRIIKNGRCSELYAFKQSNNYSGYNELEIVEPPPNTLEMKPRMIRAVDNICASIVDPSIGISCSGKDAIHVQQVIGMLMKSEGKIGMYTL